MVIVKSTQKTSLAQQFLFCTLLHINIRDIGNSYIGIGYAIVKVVPHIAEYRALRPGVMINKLPVAVTLTVGTRMANQQIKRNPNSFSITCGVCERPKIFIDPVNSRLCL